MTDQIILNADVRERTGSNKARELEKLMEWFQQLFTVMKKKL